MTITVKVTRDETLRIKVAPDILRRLEQLALRFGLPSSTLAAYAVAQWLAQQEQGANVAQAVAKEIGGHAGDVIRQLVEMVESGQDKPDA
jgi:predicted transcriptional regulator